MAEQEQVNHPAHYLSDGIEVIDVIEAFKLDFNLGNAVKYILRHKAKGEPLQDLEKAKWYLDRACAAMEREEHGLPKVVEPLARAR